jgi:hypothetical protein
MNSNPVMLTVSVPIEHAEKLRKALGEAGAGVWGNYSHCSFSYTGTGRFFPNEGANPAYGKIGELSKIAEERIEMLCDEANMPAILDALRSAHPYEEPAFHYFPVKVR